MKKESFGTTTSGVETTLFTLTNGNGANVQLTDFGGTLVGISVPDRQGNLGDVVIGFETINAFQNNTPYFGALIGRNANRIANGRFELDGTVYQLAQNNGPNNLHGGPNGFDQRIWQATPVGENRLELYLDSPDGDCGFPGRLQVWVTYSWSEENELRIDYRGEADAPTIVNLTNHTYFNLAGQGSVLDHEIEINADHFTPVNPVQIPTGELRPVAGTPFDFRGIGRIGGSIEGSNRQLRFGNGYDHNFVLNAKGNLDERGALVLEPSSGRQLEVHTTEPGVQLYTGNFLEHQVGKAGMIYAPRTGFCLETQNFPDAVNQPAFPSPILRPGETYRSTTIYRFSTFLG